MPPIEFLNFMKLTILFTTLNVTPCTCQDIDKNIRIGSLTQRKHWVRGDAVRSVARSRSRTVVPTRTSFSSTGRTPSHD